MRQNKIDNLKVGSSARLGRTLRLLGTAFTTYLIILLIFTVTEIQAKEYTDLPIVHTRTIQTMAETPNELLGSIGDSVWHDTNRDGNRDVGEFGLEGVHILLMNNATSTSTLVLTTTTDADGTYLFTDLLLGGYTVTVDTSTLPNDKLTVPNADPDGGGDSTAQTYLTEAEPHTRAIDFGYERDPNIARLGQWFWVDANQNGIKEPTEEAVVDATVNLYNEQGQLVATTTTNIFGYFVFLVPSGVYQLEFAKPDGYTFTTLGVDDPTAPDINRHTGFTLPIFLEPGEFDPSWNAGIVANPTAINLSRFTVESADEHQIHIRWVTSAEIDTNGFHILRSSDGTLAGARSVTERLIQSKGSAGGSYKVVLPYNEPVEPPLHLLNFWLLESEVNGTENYYGPVGVSLVAGQTSQSLYLPFLTR